MADCEIRCAVEVRQDATRLAPGVLYGVLLTYGETAGDRRERFAHGALHWPEGGIVVNEQHARHQPIMRVVPEVRGRDVVIDAPLPDTQRARDIATMIRNGTMRGLSVEFHSERQAFSGGVREIRSAKLLAAAVVDDPSYTGSTVEVRERSGERRRWWR